MSTGSATAVNLIGAGLCGSLLGLLLARRGFEVTLYERGFDPRVAPAGGGRSINLALSARGMRALEHAGVMAKVEPLLMPMTGRLIHGEDGTTELQPYGQRAEERIYSVSRAGLNELLIDAAEKSHGVDIRFRQEAVKIDADGWVQMHDLEQARRYELRSFPVIAADGAGSTMRRSLDALRPLGVTEALLPHGYKELTLPPGPGGGFQLEPGALHIWPRGGFMLIALPNPGGDFTLTLFLANEGAPGFAELDAPLKVEAFFERYFVDVAPLIPDLAATFLDRPLGVLGTVRCRHWHDRGKVLLIGDAAHAIVPFHGQGMNLAFEDCVLLDGIQARGLHDWEQVFAQFEAAQKANAEAIADMALENYVEMRDTVRQPKFVLQKQLAFELERRCPDRFIPRYSMVMFHDEIPYAVAQRRGTVQQDLLEQLTRAADTLDDIDFDAAVALIGERLPPISSEMSNTAL